MAVVAFCGAAGDDDSDNSSAPGSARANRRRRRSSSGGGGRNVARRLDGGNAMGGDGADAPALGDAAGAGAGAGGPPPVVAVGTPPVVAAAGTPLAPGINLRAMADPTRRRRMWMTIPGFMLPVNGRATQRGFERMMNQVLRNTNGMVPMDFIRGMERSGSSWLPKLLQYNLDLEIESRRDDGERNIQNDLERRRRAFINLHTTRDKLTKEQAESAWDSGMRTMVLRRLEAELNEDVTHFRDWMERLLRYFWPENKTCTCGKPLKRGPEDDEDDDEDDASGDGSGDGGLGSGGGIAAA